MQTINMLDVIVIGILIFFVLRGYRKGLVRSVFGLLSSVIALILSQALFPVVSRFLRQTGGLYGYFKLLITKHLGLSDVVHEQTVLAESQFINALHVPDFLSKSLLSKNNNELYQIFNVSTVEDYVASYIANLIINGIAIALVFCAVVLVMRLLSGSLNLVTKLPVIGSFNRLGGGLCGIVVGTLVIWLLFTLSTFFVMKPPVSDLFATLPHSKIAFIFYENNVIMNMVLKIVP